MDLFKKKTPITTLKYDKNSPTYIIISDLIKLSLVLYALIPIEFIDLLKMEPYNKVPEIEIGIIPFIDKFMDDFDNDYREDLNNIVSSPLIDQLKKDYYRDSKQLIMRILRDYFPQYQRDNINKITNILAKRKGTLLTELDKHACNMLFKQIAKVPRYQISLISPELELIITNASNIVIYMNAVCTSPINQPITQTISTQPIDKVTSSKLSTPISIPPVISRQSYGPFNQPVDFNPPDDFDPSSFTPPPPPPKLIPQTNSKLSIPPSLPPRPKKPIDYIKISYSNTPVPFSGQYYKPSIDNIITGGNKKRRKSSKRRQRK